MNKTILLAIMATMAFSFASAQAKFGAKDNITIKVTGTSTMHDWEMKSNAGECSATFALDSEGAITKFESMSFSVSSKALKSGKTAMDKNAYKALKADQHSKISAVLVSGEVSSKDKINYTLKGKMKLTIAGQTRETDIVATAKRINDTSFSIKGEKNIKMTDYGMAPPSFMMGAVKTGDAIELGFDLVIHQR